jgi:hypothetical protein
VGRNQLRASRRWRERKVREERHARKASRTALVLLGVVLVLCCIPLLLGVRVRVSKELVKIEGVLINMIYDDVTAEAFRLACQRNPRLIHEQDPIVGRPVDLALKVERLDLVEILLKLGVDPNVKVEGLEYTGDTPLSLAVRSENVEAVRLLLSYGADPELTDADGKNSRAHAAERDNLEIRELLQR